MAKMIMKVLSPRQKRREKLIGKKVPKQLRKKKRSCV